MIFRTYESRKADYRPKLEYIEVKLKIPPKVLMDIIQEKSLTPERLCELVSF